MGGARRRHEPEAMTAVSARDNSAACASDSALLFKELRMLHLLVLKILPQPVSRFIQLFAEAVVEPRDMRRKMAKTYRMNFDN